MIKDDKLVDCDYFHKTRKAAYPALLSSCSQFQGMGLLAGFYMTKRTLEGTNRKQKRKSGFRARMRTKNGQAVIKARRSKGRVRLSV